VAISAGRSAARKKGPRDVPPRMNKQGIAVCIPVSEGLGSLDDGIVAALRGSA